jgi:hypothetical protein
MTALDRLLSPEDVIRVSLSSVPDPGARLELSTALIVLGLKLAGYQIVPLEGAAPIGVSSSPRPSVPAAGGSSAPTPELAAPAPEQEKRKDPLRFPFSCPVCHKIRNDRAHAEECDNSRCPI